MSIIQPAPSSAGPKGPHCEEYLISLLCEIVKTEEGLEHRGVIFKVFQRVKSSADLELLRQSGMGAAATPDGSYRLVRAPEMYMNGPFEGLESRIRELFHGDPILTQASFELKHGEYTDQIRRAYFLEHGFSHTNIPWAAFAKHYMYGKGYTKKEYAEKYNIGMGSTGFIEQGFKGDNDVRLDPDSLQASFSPEQLKQAERSAEILTSLVKKKT